MSWNETFLNFSFWYFILFQHIETTDFLVLLLYSATWWIPLLVLTVFNGDFRVFFICELVQFSSVQSLSHVQLPAIPWTAAPGLPIHHQCLEFTQSHVHSVGDAMQPSHPLLSLSPPTFSLSQYQDLFKWVSSLHQVAKILEFQLQHQSFQWTLRTDLL